MIHHRQLNSKTTQLPKVMAAGFRVKHFPEEVKPAFTKISQKLGSSTSRQFFGAIDVQANEVVYTALMIPKDDHECKQLGLEPYLLPGGAYVSSKLVNWTKNTHLIKELFAELESKYHFDACRPQLEYYKNNRELILMLPIKPREQQLSMNLF